MLSAEHIALISETQIVKAEQETDIHKIYTTVCCSPSWHGGHHIRLGTIKLESELCQMVHTPYVWPSIIPLDCLLNEYLDKSGKS